MMMASKSYEKHLAHNVLYDAPIQSLFMDEDDMDQAAAAMNQSAQLKRNLDDKDEDPTTGSNRGKDKKRPRKDTQPYVVDDQLEQTWFNDLVSAQKDPLTFDKLMTTPIDFSKFAKNYLKLDKITKADLVEPVYNLLKGTCQSSIEFEYNMEECYKAL
ncbi:hypothetical protein Tco_0916054 [Tanacetum coccineum]